MNITRAAEARSQAVSPLSMWGTAHPPVRFTRRREQGTAMYVGPTRRSRTMRGGSHRRDPNRRLETTPCLRGVPGPRVLVLSPSSSDSGVLPFSTRVSRSRGGNYGQQGQGRFEELED